MKEKREIKVLRTFYDGAGAQLSEVVDVIRCLPPDGAERFLQAILDSPAVGRRHGGDVLCLASLPNSWEGLLRTPEQSLRAIADAAGQTSKEARDKVAIRLAEDSKLNGIMFEDQYRDNYIGRQYIDSLGKPAASEAAQRAARRAREDLGLSKPRGRRKETDKNR